MVTYRSETCRVDGCASAAVNTSPYCSTHKVLANRLSWELRTLAGKWLRWLKVGNVANQKVGHMGLFGFGKSRDQKFADFAEKACHSPQIIMIKLKEAYPLVLALEKSLTRVKGLDSKTAFRKASDGISLTCPHCGKYNDEARDVALLSGEGGAVGQFKGVVFGGPIVAALGQGRCPGCKGEQVTASFDPRTAGV